MNRQLKIVAEYPESRFCQILSGLGLDEDKFYEESEETLKTARWDVFGIGDK